MHTAIRHIVRFSRDRKARLYCAVCVCLLVVAVGLRFHALPEHYLWTDEAAAANFSRGTFSETISNTRRYNSSPILYPLALWVVQKVESTPFSLRVVSATASVLTVAVILLVLPRLGVARGGAALLAAICATLSVEAIRHAQDAREYSIDALLAVLMTAGLLWHLRDGRKALLCTSLFLAPLVQYGLVLFGAAVLDTALVFPPHATLAAPEWHSGPGRIRHWLQQHIALLWPAACFLAGCTLSYPVTVHHQREIEYLSTSGYLAPHFYQGPFDAPSLFGFAIDGLWNLLTYHLPEGASLCAHCPIIPSSASAPASMSAKPRSGKASSCSSSSGGTPACTGARGATPGGGSGRKGGDSCLEEHWAWQIQKPVHTRKVFQFSA